MITVYGSFISPFVRKVACLLELKNIPYTNEELSTINETHRPLLLSMNPLGKIPILKDGSFTLPDSSVICAYIEKKYPEHTLIPSDPEHYAKSLWYEEYADTHFFSAVGTIFFNKVLAPFLNRPADATATQEAIDKKLPEIFNYLNQEIGQKKYVAGNKLSIADISLFGPFLNLELTGYDLDAKRWPNLARYIREIEADPKIQKIISRAKERYKARFENK